jgi:glycosyltransferase involved in cell wall biosynthesis
MVFRIGMEARAINTRFIRGMGEYLTALIRFIGESEDVAWYLYGNRPDLPFHRPEGNIARISLRDVPGNRYNVWEQAVLPAEALFNRVDVLHCTSTTLPWWQPVPTVVTVHDTIPWNTGETMPPGFYRDQLLPSAYAKCRTIITDSEHSRRDIIQLWPVLADKIKVIHLGVSDDFLDSPHAAPTDGLRDFGIGKPYFLYLGGAAPRKRLAWTFDLFHALDCQDIDLVVCGVGAADHMPFRDTLDPALRDRVVFLPFVPACDMPMLYQNAIAILYPTLYEGFGLPAVNAQAAGTPIVLSAVSSLLELVGPTSYALPPEDTDAWLTTCRSLIDARKGSATPDPASRRWARRFDWRNTAAATWEVYRDAALRT